MSKSEMKTHPNAAPYDKAMIAKPPRHYTFAPKPEQAKRASAARQKRIREKRLEKELGLR